MKGCSEIPKKKNYLGSQTEKLPVVPMEHKKKWSDDRTCVCCTPLASWWNEDWKPNRLNHNEWCGMIKNSQK